jgi:hypothetical protein
MDETAATPVVAGWFYWLELAGKRRPVVVLEVRARRARVIVGTTRQRWPVRVAERPTTRQGRCLALSKTTYFYHDSIHIVDLDNFAGAEGKPCPPNLLLDIRTLLQEFPESVET